MNQRWYTARSRPVSAALGLVIALLTTAPGATAATQPQPEPLILVAVGAQEGYFSISLAPGQTQELTVSRGNKGTEPLTAQTFSANAYTVVNGGFGADKTAESASGATTWTDYPNEVVELASGQASEVTFTVTVPPGTTPGDYLTSIILQEEKAAAGSGTMTIDQVVRQAVAIAVRVPGDYVPSFTLGAASHAYNLDRSVVSVVIDNAGNQNLRPAGEFTIEDPRGTVVSDWPVTMGSFYSQTSTSVATTFANALLPGEYTISGSMTDVQTGATATLTKEPFTVLPPPTEGVFEQFQLPQIVQDGPSFLLIALLIAVIVAALIAGWILLRRKRRRAAALVAASTASDADGAGADASGADAPEAGA